MVARSVLVLLIVFSPITLKGPPQTDKPMTNQDVILLVKAGLSSDVIINKIGTSPVAFDLSVDGLTMLAQNHVPNENRSGQHQRHVR